MCIFPQPIRPEAVDSKPADQAVQTARFVGPESDFHDLTPGWSQATAIGVDTEFVRERTFYPQPGLVQISDGQSIWLLDPVGREDFTAMGEVLDNRNVIKILHSAGEDLEVFRLLTNTLPAPLFDTQIAAAMLGFPLQCRYEALVEACFGVTLPGGQARSNWCKRPLSPKLLEYAAQDVIWLPRLKDKLVEALDRENRLQWLHEDCLRLIQSANQSLPPLLRVKGAGKLDDQQLGWLKRLVEWREQQARERDLPRGFVLRDDVMLSLTEAAGNHSQLQNTLASLPHPVQRRHGDQLLEMLDGPPPERCERPLELTALDNEQRQRLAQAQQLVRTMAKDLGVDPALIASKRELTRLIRGETPDWLDGWRGQLLGDLATI